MKPAKAQIAQDMEGRKQGETLELLDPPSLPLNPTEPRRPMIMGWVPASDCCWAS